MIARSELSPLYTAGFTREGRHAIQTHNKETILNGMSEYSLQAGRRQVFLKGLNVNGLNTDEATLNVLFNPVTTLLTYLEHPEAAGMLCRLDMHAYIDSLLDWQEEEIPYWRIEAKIIQTSPGYEGNGYAQSLWLATETLVPAWIHFLGEPRRVIAYHVDGARGAEEPADQIQGYRTNWTSNLLQELGYTNTLGNLDYYLGERKVAELGDPNKHWIKILRG